MELTTGSGLIGIHGRLKLTVLDKDKNIVDEREGDNVMCTNGLTAIANSLVYSGIQSVATSIGVTTPTYLSPLYGAVGSGTGTVSAADTSLFAELGREPVESGASTPATPTINAQYIWLFYFPSPSTTWTVTEAGVFANATSASTPLSSAGVMLDHWLFSPSVTVTTANTLILQSSFTLAGM